MDLKISEIGLPWNHICKITLKAGCSKSWDSYKENRNLYCSLLNEIKYGISFLSSHAMWKVKKIHWTKLSEIIFKIELNLAKKHILKWDVKE